QRSKPLQKSAEEICSRLPEVLGRLYPWQRNGLERDDNIKETAAVTEKAPLDGTTGILSGVVLDGERIDKELAEEREKARVQAERELTLQRVLDDIDASFEASPYLAEKFKKEASAQISAEADKTFAAFQQFCVDWNLPSWPDTVPQAIVLFIAEEAKDGPQAR